MRPARVQAKEQSTEPPVPEADNEEVESTEPETQEGNPLFSDVLSGNEDEKTKKQSSQLDSPGQKESETSDDSRMQTETREGGRKETSSSNS